MLKNPATWALPLYVCGVGLVVAILMAGLPPNAFYAGDSGVKLIAAFSAIEHPGRPFQVDLPTIGGAPVPAMERFFAVHGTHAHALQSPLFPAISAPMIAAFGLRGAYLLPALGFLAFFPLLHAINRRGGPGSPARLLMVLALVANPLFFYALEFWEHVPAAACLAASTALLLGGRDTRTGTGRAAGAGILAAAAVCLRPEAVWYAAALAVIVFARRGVLPYLVGLAVPLSVYAFANYVEAGTIAGPHASANLAALSDHWLATRVHRTLLWLIPQSAAHLAGFVLAAGAWVAVRLGANARRAQVVALLGISFMAVASARGALSHDCLWHAWPAGFLLLLPRAENRGHAALWWLAGLTTVGILLTSTHDGGAQWGPRILLVATPALLVLAAAAGSDAVGAGPHRWLRRGLVGFVILCSLWTSRAAYLELRGTKRYYARLVAQTAAVAPPGSAIVFNPWWFDQVTASLYDTRTFLYADSPSRATALVNALGAAGAEPVVLAWSRNPTEAPSLLPAISGSCYRIREIREVAERQMTFVVASCR